MKRYIICRKNGRKDVEISAFDSFNKAEAVLRALKEKGAKRLFIKEVSYE